MNKFYQGKPSNAIVTDGDTKGRGGILSTKELTERYGGRLVAESVDPEFKALLIAAPDLLEVCENEVEELANLASLTDLEHTKKLMDTIYDVIARAKQEQESYDQE